jgi:predicted GTPase
LKDLEETISRIECDAVVLGTPSNLSRVVKIIQPVARVHFEAKEVDGNKLREKLISILKN